MGTTPSYLGLLGLNISKWCPGRVLFGIHKASFTPQPPYLAVRTQPLLDPIEADVVDADLPVDLLVDRDPEDVGGEVLVFDAKGGGRGEVPAYGGAQVWWCPVMMVPTYGGAHFNMVLYTYGAH